MNTLPCINDLLANWPPGQKESSPPEHLLHSNDPPLDSDIQGVCGIIEDDLSTLGLLDQKIAYIQKIILDPLLRQRNETEKRIHRHTAIMSPLRRIPPEILCKIFSFSLPSAEELNRLGPSFGHRDRFIPAPWALTHICSRWRLVALSMSPLW
ncbi:hypothetical protein C8R44DRAFT_599817, partial [Mycena epipterygia]